MVEVYAPVSLPELFVPGRYGLTSVVRWVTPSDVHWTGGIQYDADCTEVSITMMECVSGAPSPVPPKGETWDHLVRGARAFDVFGRSDCSPVGDWWDTAQTKALRALSQSAPTQLERTLWTGDGNADPALVFPNLTSTGPRFDGTGRILLQPAGVNVSGSPLDVVEGLGVLESNLGDCYDGEGVIHAPFRLGSALFAQHLCYIDGSVLRTYNGNLVVLGRGYPDDYGPGGSVPPINAAWMFATSSIFGIKGQPRTFTRVESFERTTNTLQMIAEQKYLLGWECCLTGVLVTLGGEPAGVFGTSASA